MFCSIISRYGLEISTKRELSENLKRSRHCKMDDNIKTTEETWEGILEDEVESGYLP